VNARIELDLRIGSAFTRFQTLTLQQRIGKIGEEKLIISYGLPPKERIPLKYRILSIPDTGVCRREMEKSGEFRSRTVLVH
jgi:hypothetical protein